MRKRSIISIVLLSLILLAPLPVHAGAGLLSDKVICLDPGHGGSDPGAVYNDGTIYLEEEDINLDEAYRLKSLLEADGATVVMTRVDDSYKSNNDRYTFANKAGATILVSIHTNSVSSSSADGTCTLYMKKTDKVLAQVLQDTMYPALLVNAPDRSVFLNRGLIRYASGVLLKTQMPAAMVEPVFMSNPGEAKMLATPIYTDNGVTLNQGCVACRRAQIAQAVRDGILNYFASGG